MKALITKDTFISGKPVRKGEVFDLDEGTSNLLFQYRKAVDLNDATKDQKALIEARQKIDEANVEKLSTTAGAISR